MQEDTAAELLGDCQTDLSFSTDKFGMPEQLFADSSTSDMDDIPTSDIEPMSPINGTPSTTQADVPAPVPSKPLEPVPPVAPASPNSSPAKPPGSLPLSPEALGNNKIILVPMNQAGISPLPTNINVPAGQNIVFIKPEDLNLLKNVEGKKVTLIATKTSPLSSNQGISGQHALAGKQTAGTAQLTGGQQRQALPNTQVSQAKVQQITQTNATRAVSTSQVGHGQPVQAVLNKQVPQKRVAQVPSILRPNVPSKPVARPQVVSGQPRQAPNVLVGQLRVGQPTHPASTPSLRVAGQPSKQVASPQAASGQPRQAPPNVQASQHRAGQPTLPASTPSPRLAGQVTSSQIVARPPVPNVQASQIKVGQPTQASPRASVPTHSQNAVSGVQPKKASPVGVAGARIVQLASQVQAVGQGVKPGGIHVHKGTVGAQTVQIIASDKQVHGSAVVSKSSQPTVSNKTVQHSSNTQGVQTVPTKVSVGTQQGSGTPVGQVLKKIFGQPQAASLVAQGKPVVKVGLQSTPPVPSSSTNQLSPAKVPSISFPSPTSQSRTVHLNQSGLVVPQVSPVNHVKGTSSGITIVSKAPISVPASRPGSSMQHSSPSMFPSSSQTVVPLSAVVGQKRTQAQNASEKVTPVSSAKKTRTSERKVPDKPEPPRGPTLQDELNRKGSHLMGRSVALHQGQSQLKAIKHTRVTSNNPWKCCLCGHGAYQQTLGCLYGPYDETKDVLGEAGNNSSEHKRKQSTETEDDEDMGSPRKKGDATGELWLHGECAVWSPGIYVTGDSLAGFRQAVSDGKSGKCSCCGNVGATLVCFQRNCKKLYHFVCARKAGCIFNESNYTIQCGHHK